MWYLIHVPSILTYVLRVTEKKYSDTQFMCCALLKKKLQYTIFVSVIPQFCTGGTHLCVVCYKKIVLTSSAIHKYCISDTPNQRIPKKSRPLMIHPPDTHQSIDAYIIHVPAITDCVYLSSLFSICVNSIVNMTIYNPYCHFQIVSYKEVDSPQ